MSPLRSLLVGSLLLLVACAEPAVPPRASGSLAVSQDGLTVYAADTDNGLLIAVDAKTLEKKGEVKVGSHPFRISVGADGTVYVANRGSRSVSVVSGSDLTVTTELATGVDPVGMQLSPDNRTLYVVSATALDDTNFGTLTAYDTETHAQKWVLPVGEEPRGLGLLGADRAVISQYKTGRLLEVDLNQATISKGNVDFAFALNQQALSTPREQYGLTPFLARAMTDVATSPDGKRAFATTMLSRDAPILTQPTPDTPYYKGQGPQLAGSVSTSGLITLEREGDVLTPLVDDVSSYGFGYYGAPTTETPSAHPQTSFATTGVGSTPILQGPSVALVDSSGDWVFVVNKESSRLAIVSAHKREAKTNAQAGAAGGNYAYDARYVGQQMPSVHSTAAIDPGADGVAVLTDNKTMLVYSQFEHRMQKLTLEGGSLNVVATSAPLASETLPAEEVVGRKLFFDANNRSMSALEASVACSSCHLEGRDDGHTWQFPDGPRQTPTLAGRGMKATAPFHWSGEFDDMQKFLTHTITARMGGKGLSSVQVAQLNAFVDGAPAPENPYLQKISGEQLARGAAVYSRAGCDTCHSGQWLTNNTSADVGSLVLGGINPDNGIVMSQGLNVPSLKGLARSAPYLHDGSAMTIKARVLKNVGDKHGVTSNLTTEDVDDLVAYLQTL